MTVSDPAFPRLHGRPDRGWINDPNGLAVIDGRYHVFFQHNPDAPVHADIGWGHVSSTDLVRWRQEPMALAPRTGGPDELGCFSGCLVDENSVPTAVYTAITRTRYTGVVLATSDRSAVTWIQEESVLENSDQPRGIGIRDPYLFTYAGHRYAVQGGGVAGGVPRVLLYGCDDLHEWTFLGDLLTAEDPVADTLENSHVWECPNLFELGGSWVLLGSPLTMEPDRFAHGEVFALIGQLDADGSGLHFRAESTSPVDTGPSFYAPQVLADGERRLLWGWTKDLGRSDDEIARVGWTGSLTFPRELRLIDGALASVPAAELTGLRRERLDVAGRIVADRAFEIEGELDDSPGGFQLILQTGDAAEVVVDLPGDQAHDVRILVDGSIVEVFTADGPAQTLRSYPTEDSQWRIESDASLRVWRLGLPEHDC